MKGKIHKVGKTLVPFQQPCRRGQKKENDPCLWFVRLADCVAVGQPNEPNGFIRKTISEKAQVVKTRTLQMKLKKEK